MEIYIRGLASGYEPEHVTRLFFQPALLAKRWPARGADAVAVLRGKKRFVCGVRMNVFRKYMFLFHFLEILNDSFDGCSRIHIRICICFW